MVDSPPSSAPPPAPNNSRRVGVAVGVSVVVAGGCAWLMYKGGLPVVPHESAFDSVRWWVMPVYVAVFWFCLLLRAVRWHWLVQPIQRVGMLRLLTVSFIFFGATIALPFRTGELVRPLLLYRKEHFSWWAVTGIVGAERITDGLVLSVLLFVALQLAQPLPVLPHHIGNLPVPVAVVPSAAYSALAMFAGAFVAMGLFYWRRERMRRATVTAIGVVSHQLAELVAGVLERLADGLGFLPKTRYSVPFLGVTVAYWVIHALNTWMLIWGVGLDSVTATQGAAVLGVLALGFLTPNAPGFFGTFQIALYAGLAMYLPPHEVVDKGAAAVFLMYVLQMGVVLGAAAIALVVESLSPPRQRSEVPLPAPAEA